MIPGLGRSPGEGNGNPLQYSCLENPMDGGAWWATVHGVAKSQTQLSAFTFTFLQIYSRVLSLFFWDPYNVNLVHLMFSQKSLRLSSFLFILFSLFFSAALISTSLSFVSFILLPHLFYYLFFLGIFHFNYCIVQLCSLKLVFIKYFLYPLSLCFHFFSLRS